MKFKAQQTKRNNKLDKKMVKALKEMKQGKLIGPFTSAQELEKSLEE